MESTTEVSDGIPPGLSTCLTWFFIYSFCIQANTVLIQERQFVLSACFWSRKSVSSECGPTGKNQSTYSSRRHAAQECRPAHFKQWYTWQETGNGNGKTVAQSTQEKEFFTPWSFTIRSCKCKTKTKSSQHHIHTRHDNLCILIYIPLVLGSFIILNYTKLLPKLPWRSQSTIVSNVSLVQFSKLPTKWKKQAQKSSNIWHKPSWRCLRGCWTCSPQQRQTRTVRPQCASGEPQIRRNQSLPRPGSRESQPSFDNVPKPSLMRGQAVPFTQRQDTGFGTVNQSVSSGIWSWSDVQEEGTMEPASWCSEVPYSDGVVQEAVYTTVGPAYVVLKT